MTDHHGRTAAREGLAPGERGAAEARQSERNLLLRALPARDFAVLREALVPVTLSAREVLIEPGAPIEHVVFLAHGLASTVAPESHGGPIEVGVVGSEGFVGLPPLFGADRTPFRVLMQVEGRGWRLDAGVFRRAVDQMSALRALALRYAHYYTEQVSQRAVCNRLHSVEQRVARWLLSTHEAAGGDDFAVTHEFIAQMLGVRRAGVTVAVGALDDAAVLSLARGRVRVLDARRLDAAACGCQRTVRRARAALESDVAAAVA